ncbi:YncE family protein [Chitinophagaceae bacterium MMS25-I14]
MTLTFRKTALAAVLTITAHCSDAQKVTYKIISIFPVSGDAKWDYIAISPANGYLYVAHGTEVNIVNKETGAAIGVISNTPGVHGVAFSTKNGKGFTSNGKENTVSVFDINTNEIQGKIKTGENPDAIMYEPFSDRVIVCNGRSRDLSIINPANNEVTATIAVGGKPETAVSDEKGQLYINVEDKNEVVMIDLKDMKLKAHWPLGKGTAPSGLAIDRKNNKLFAGCDNKMLVVMNAKTGKAEQTVSIGDGCDGVAFDASSGLIFSSNGEGTLTVISRDTKGHYIAAQNLQTQKGARTLTVDEKTGIVYLPVASFMPQTGTEKGKPAIQPGSFKIIAAGH